MVRGGKGTDSLSSLLVGKQYKDGLQEVIRTTSIRPSDLDSKAILLLDALQQRGRACDACQYLKQALEGIGRDRIANWRAYVYTLLRGFDEAAYATMKADTKGESRKRQKEKVKDRKATDDRAIEGGTIQIEETTGWISRDELGSVKAAKPTPPPEEEYGQGAQAAFNPGAAEFVPQRTPQPAASGRTAPAHHIGNKQPKRPNLNVRAAEFVPGTTEFVPGRLAWAPAGERRLKSGAAEFVPGRPWPQIPAPPQQIPPAPKFPPSIMLSTPAPNGEPTGGQGGPPSFPASLPDSWEPEPAAPKVPPGAPLETGSSSSHAAPAAPPAPAAAPAAPAAPPAKQLPRGDAGGAPKRFDGVAFLSGNGRVVLRHEANTAAAAAAAANAANNDPDVSPVDIAAGSSMSSHAFADRDPLAARHRGGAEDPVSEDPECRRTLLAAAATGSAIKSRPRPFALKTAALRRSGGRGRHWAIALEGVLTAQECRALLQAARLRGFRPAAAGEQDRASGSRTSLLSRDQWLANHLWKRMKEHVPVVSSGGYVLGIGEALRFQSGADVQDKSRGNSALVLVGLGDGTGTEAGHALVCDAGNLAELSPGWLSTGVHSGTVLCATVQYSARSLGAVARAACGLGGSPDRNRQRGNGLALVAAAAVATTLLVRLARR